MRERVLVVALAGQDLALPLAAVRECLPLPRLWRRPGLPAAVAGFFALGDRTVPVVDLARLLGLRMDEAAAPEAGGLYRHLVRLDAAALLVDRVCGVEEPEPAPPDPVPDPWQHGCVAARLLVAGRPVALLDPERVLDRDERARLALLAEQAGQRDRLWNEGPRDADG